MYTAKDGEIEHIYSNHGTGVGLLYKLITKELGLEAGKEGKTMGLAPFGEEYKLQDKYLPSLTSDDLEYSVDYSKIMTRAPSHALKVKIRSFDKNETSYDPYFARLSFNLQQELERNLIYTAKKIKQKTKMENLCYAGGVALNCVGNQKLRESEILRKT